jgi:SGNH domain (fused to AT3 domains)
VDAMVTPRRFGTWITGASVALAAIALFCAAVPSLAATTISPAPSEKALVSALSAGLLAKALPKVLTPTLRQLSSDPYAQEGAVTFVKASCDPYTYPSEAANPQPCWFGATKKTDPVIVIYGDSFVGNWMPALDSAGRALGFRVAEFEFKGCFTSFTPSSTEPGFDTTQVAACNEWHTTLPPAVVRLRPKVIMAANGTPVWRVAQAAWLAGMQLAFKELNPKGTSVDILIGTGIELVTPAPECLAANTTDIQTCTFQYTAASDTQQSFERDAAVAASIKHVRLMTTYQWVCHEHACPLIVSHVIVYADDKHVTVAYSDYLSRVFLRALRSILVSAHALPVRASPASG